jgi:hypothetical protein
LGDWYANILYLRPQHWILCISARTLLPVIVPAKDVRSVSTRLSQNLGEVLRALQVSDDAARKELSNMEIGRIDRTDNRRLISSLNELVILLKHQSSFHPEFSLTEHALHLAETPMKFLDHSSPDRATCAVFGVPLERQLIRKF